MDSCYKFTRKEFWPMPGISLATPGSLETALAANSLSFDLGTGDIKKRELFKHSDILSTTEVLKLLGWVPCRVKENRNSGFKIISAFLVDSPALCMALLSELIPTILALFRLRETVTKKRH